LINASKSLGFTPKELEPLPFPEVFRYCWNWFLALNNARPSSGFGASPLLYSEIQAYFALQSIEPESWEVDVIKMFDQISLNIFREQQEKKQQEDARKAKNNNK